MALSLVRKFSNMAMGVKLTVVFLSVILIPMTLLAYISYSVIDSRLQKDAQEKINMGLKSAWTEYYVRGDQMRYGMLQAASMEEIRSAVERGDKQYLRRVILTWKEMRPYVDVWIVTDTRGRVIARLNSESSGDTVRIGGMVERAVETGEPRISSEILSRDVLRNEGAPLLDEGRARLEGGVEESAPVMALVVATPVFDGRRRPLGAIITADILNNDDYIPHTVSSKIPGLLTSISAGDKRISSNIVDLSGRSVKGTSLPADALRAVSAGKPVFTEWELTGATLITMFEPIRNSDGAVIGSLSVGISKEKLWEIQEETQWIIALITVLGLAFSLLAAIVSTSEITRPLKSLKDKLGEFARGDLRVRVVVGDNGETRDELKTLGRAFNSMMDGVERREEEKERYLREIEEKNTEFAELNEEMKTANESLEVAYEETQSQTEELHAINEELKLLNEDLDRKNLELQRANRIIT
ncbi:MAG: cache domain-containing protein, partial [Deltaproteobacteria bacterium]|nr:cache domain-containing protein [Deltaproteobacteria bacterium]